MGTTRTTTRTTSRTSPRIADFNLDPGRILAAKYEVVSKLGEGWEGEVYLVREVATGIARAAKFFFPHRNPNDRTARFYARKLHKLRHCPILIQYVGRETFVHRRTKITFLVSEFVEGALLSELLARQPGKRLSPYEAVHLLHALAQGIELIHRLREYHGDLHSGNVIVQRFGLGIDLKLLDLYHWSTPRPENIRDDVVDMIKIFHEAVGGKKRYANQPEEVKAICCGLKRSLIIKKFRTAGGLRRYLETMEWS
jgi:serine/threonine protein kinase